MCSCPNVIDGEERFQGIFQKFVSFDSLRRTDELFVIFIALAAAFFTLQLLFHASFNKYISIIGQALKVIPGVAPSLLKIQTLGL